jgi:hypothetical protein
MKNNSSNERVFGLGDMPKTQYVPKGSKAMGGETFGKRQYSRGRGSGSQQGGILDFGNYGQD